MHRFLTKTLDGLSNVLDNTRLKLLQLESLEYRRLISDLVLCYKMQHGLVDTEPYDALPRSASVTPKGYSFRLHKVSRSFDVTKYFPTNRIYEVWNGLPASVITSGTITIFKYWLHNINLWVHLHYPCYI